MSNNKFPMRLAKGKHSGMCCGDIRARCRHINILRITCGNKFRCIEHYTKHCRTCTSQQLIENSDISLIGYIMGELRYLRGELIAYKR